MRQLTFLQTLCFLLLLFTIHPGRLSAQVTPTITWADPADIVLATPLGPTQLNATASVPGTFTYNPGAGSVLPGGSGQTLTVSFSPTDSVNYTNASKSVHINVLEGRISGTVTGTAGVPLQSMTVKAYNSSGALSKSTITAADGSYTITGLNAGSYFVKVDDNRVYIGQLYSGLSCPFTCDVTAGMPVQVALGAVATNVNVALVERGGITGKVVDASGAPLFDVGVVIYSTTGNWAGSVNTDLNGEYAVPYLAPGTYVAVASVFSSEYLDGLYDGGSCPINCTNTTVSTGTPIKVASGTTTSNINFVLNIGGRISGRVTRPGGTPAVNSLVWVFDSTGRQLRAGITDANGNYTVNRLAAGTYFAWALKSASGDVDQYYNGVICQGCNITSKGTPISVAVNTTTPNIDFALTNGGSIAGKVTLTGGFSPGSITVQVRNTTGGTFTATPNSSDGTYIINGLAAGPYIAQTINAPLIGFINQLSSGASLQPSCLPSAVGTISVAVGITTPNINFAPARGGRISGKVTNLSGAYFPNMLVQFYDATGCLVGSTNTINDGTFLSPGLTAGSYFIRAGNGLGAQDQLYGGVSCEFGCDVKAGTAVTVTVGTTIPNINLVLPNTGTLSGHVADDGDTGVAGATIQAYDAAGNFVRSVISDVFGAYSLTLRPGTYFLRTTNSPGYVEQLYSRKQCGPTCSVTAGKPVTVTANVDTLSINFVLTESSFISGKVNLPGRADMSGATVEIYNASGTLVAIANTNTDGLYTARGLLAGSYFARTRNSLGYADQLFGASACVSCTVTAGAPIAVTFSATTSNINFSLAPSLTSLTPSNGGQGGDISVILTGSNFVSGLTVNAGTGITVSNVVVLSPTLVSAKLSIAPTAVLGPQDVAVSFGGATSNAVEFTVSPPELTVSKTGTGNGSVVSSPAGIDCGNTCSTTFTFGQVFALTATPSAGSVFAGWNNNDVDCLDGIVTMTTGRNCIARFDLPQTNSTLLRGDYDGDGKTDIAVYRPSTGEWYLRLSTQGYVIAAGNWYFQWGVPGDVPLSGDFDGDGKSDIAVYRPSTGEWFSRLSTLSYAVAQGNWYFQWGVPGDVPITGDFDGDGKTDISVYRPATGEWYIRLSTQNYAIAVGNWYFEWGVPLDQPIASDFDGDGKTDIAVFRPSTGEWFLRLSSENYAIATGRWYFLYGNSDFQPVAGDYDGDRKSDLAVYRPSTGEWFLRLSTLNYDVTAGNLLFQWGIPGDLPIKGDFDGDGKADIAVYRPSTGEWFFRLSTQGYSYFSGNWYFQWGVAGDLPIRR